MLLASALHGAWPGSTVTIAASAPSLSSDQIATARRLGRVIAINRTLERVPGADAFYASDYPFWVAYPELWRPYPGPRFSQSERAAKRFQVHHVTRGRQSVWLRGEVDVWTGGHSGHQAIGLATLLGASRVICIGMDMRYTDARHRHWHGQHRAQCRTPYAPQARWRSEFVELVDLMAARGVKVLQASPGWQPFGGVEAIDIKSLED